MASTIDDRPFLIDRDSAPWSPTAIARGLAADAIVIRFATIQLVFLIFFQKVGLPVGEDGVSLTIPAYYGGLAMLLATHAERVAISLVRAVAFAAFFGSILVSQLLLVGSSSTASLMLMLVLYLPFLFVVEASPEAYRRILGRFCDFMVVGAAAVFVQLAYEAALGAGHTLSLAPLLPKFLALKGYFYEAPIATGNPFVRPNGFFFLEPSFISLFLGCALLVEVREFRRPWRLALYVAAMLGSMGATGVVLTALAAPFLFFRERGTTRALVLLAGVVGVVLLVATGHFEALFGRLSELSSPSTSGFARLVKPIEPAIEAMADPRMLFRGVGAGHASPYSWAFSKLMIEYGVLTGLLFIVFITICFARAPNPPLAVAMFVIYNLTGGYLHSAFFTMPILLLIAGIRPEARLAPPDADGAGSQPG